MNWECVSIIPARGETHPQFLEGPEVDEKPELLAEGDTDVSRLERWNYREWMRLRKAFDGGFGQCGDSAMSEFKREFTNQLDMMGFSVKDVERWLKGRVDDDRLLVRICFSTAAVV